jgi:hypothetical protein
MNMDTMREDLMAAMEDEPENDTPEAEAEVVDTPSAEAAPEVDDAPKDEIPEGEAEPIEEPKPDTEVVEGAKPAEAAAQESVKAPVDWSPSQRESWSKVPRDIQDKIIAREKDMADAIAGTGEARRTHDHFAKLASSFAPVLAAEGMSNPLQAVEGLFNTVSELRMGSPQQKAVKMASLISHYGVDIQALDSVLAGQAPEQGSNAQFEDMIDQRMQPVNQLMDQLTQMQQTQNQSTMDTATASVNDFAKNAEFMNDVRHDMADLVDMAAKRGQTVTLQQAYDKACTLNPEICTILDKRKSDAALLGDQTSIAAKEAAAGGLNGKQLGTGGGGAAMSLRDQINEAWNDAG